MLFQSTVSHYAHLAEAEKEENISILWKALFSAVVLISTTSFDFDRILELDFWFLCSYCILVSFCFSYWIGSWFNYFFLSVEVLLLLPEDVRIIIKAEPDLTTVSVIAGISTGHFLTSCGAKPTYRKDQEVFFK